MEIKRSLLPDWASGVLVVLATVAVGTLVWSLADQNRALKAALEDTVGEARRDVALLASGDEAPAVELVNLKGEHANFKDIVRDGAVVGFFNTTCPYCAATVPVWNDLFDQLSGTGITFTTVSLHDLARTQAYDSKAPLPWSTWVLTDDLSRPSLRVSAVPLTALFSAEGDVVQVWRGALTPDTATLIRGAATDALSPRAGQ